MHIHSCQSHRVVANLQVQHRQLKQLLHKLYLPHAEFYVRATQIARRLIQLFDAGPLALRRAFVLALVAGADLAIAFKLCCQQHDSFPTVTPAMESLTP